MPKDWQDLENIGVNEIKISYIKHGMEQKIEGKPTLKNPKMFFHEKSKTIVLYEDLGKLDIPKTLEELKSNEYIKSLKLINNRENYKKCIFCSQLSLQWQNFIKEYVRTKKLTTRKEFRDTNVLFSINKKIDIRLRDLVKIKTINIRGMMCRDARYESGVYAVVFNKGYLDLGTTFTGTFCEMIYSIREALIKEYTMDIFNAPLSAIINPNYKANSQGDYCPNVQKVLEYLNGKKKLWDKEKK